VIASLTLDTLTFKLGGQTKWTNVGQVLFNFQGRKSQ
jgi:hypothetical protein